MNLLKGVKIRKLYESRKDTLQDIENQFNQCPPQQKQKLRDKLTSKGILVPTQSPMFKLEANSIELEILKRQFNKTYNPPDPSQLQQAIMALNKLLTLNQETGSLAN
jgi:hypothetical protein